MLLHNGYVGVSKGCCQSTGCPFALWPMDNQWVKRGIYVSHSFKWTLAPALMPSKKPTYIILMRVLGAYLYIHIHLYLYVYTCHPARQHESFTMRAPFQEIIYFSFVWVNYSTWSVYTLCVLPVKSDESTMVYLPSTVSCVAVTFSPDSRQAHTI